MLGYGTKNEKLLKNLAFTGVICFWLYLMMETVFMIHLWQVPTITKSAAYVLNLIIGIMLATTLHKFYKGSK